MDILQSAMKLKSAQTDKERAWYSSLPAYLQKSIFMGEDRPELATERLEAAVRLLVQGTGDALERGIGMLTFLESENWRDHGIR